MLTTRLKRPSIWRPLIVTALLLASQAYLGFNVIGGQFGIASQRQMRIDIEDLKGQSATLQVDIDAYRHRSSLLEPASLDPDILTERARELLQMAKPEAMLVMTDPKTGQPISSSLSDLTVNKSRPTIAVGID